MKAREPVAKLLEVVAWAEGGAREVPIGEGYLVCRMIPPLAGAQLQSTPRGVLKIDGLEGYVCKKADESFEGKKDLKEKADYEPQVGDIIIKVNKKLRDPFELGGEKNNEYDQGLAALALKIQERNGLEEERNQQLKEGKGGEANVIKGKMDEKIGEVTAVALIPAKAKLTEIGTKLTGDSSLFPGEKSVYEILDELSKNRAFKLSITAGAAKSIEDSFIVHRAKLIEYIAAQQQRRGGREEKQDYDKLLQEAYILRCQDQNAILRLRDILATAPVLGGELLLENAIYEPFVELNSAAMFTGRTDALLQKLQRLGKKELRGDEQKHPAVQAPHAEASSPKPLHAVEGKEAKDQSDSFADLFAPDKQPLPRELDFRIPDITAIGGTSLLPEKQAIEVLSKQGVTISFVVKRTEPDSSNPVPGFYFYMRVNAPWHGVRDDVLGGTLVKFSLERSFLESYEELKKNLSDGEQGQVKVNTDIASLRNVISVGEGYKARMIQLHSLPELKEEEEHWTKFAFSSQVTPQALEKLNWEEFEKTIGPPLASQLVAAVLQQPVKQQPSGGWFAKFFLDPYRLGLLREGLPVIAVMALGVAIALPVVAGLEGSYAAGLLVALGISAAASIPVAGQLAILIVAVWVFAGIGVAAAWGAVKAHRALSAEKVAAVVGATAVSSPVVVPPRQPPAVVSKAEKTEAVPTAATGSEYKAPGP